jgi:hypothetical protein
MKKLPELESKLSQIPIIAQRQIHTDIS